MRQTIIALLLAFLLCFAAAPAGASQIPVCAAEAAILMDADSGQILYAKNIYDQQYPASITKILTGALALEALDADQMITVSHDAVFTLPVGTTHIALDEGEQITVNDLMYAMMLASANDAANVLAEAVSGSLDGFASYMTQRASEMGALNSHFVNANGLGDEDHYTTCYDMARITKYALTVNGFIKYFGGDRYQIAPTNKQEQVRYLANQHEMVNSAKSMAWPMDAEVIGGKIGWTRAAQNTLVTVAQKGERTLICVILKCPTSDDRYRDTLNLFEYGFDEFTQVYISHDDLLNVLKQDQAADGDAYSLAGGVAVLLPNNMTSDDIDYQVVSGEDGGTIELCLPDGVGAAVTVLADVDYRVLQKQEVILQKGKPVIWLVAALLLLLIGFKILRQHSKRRRSPYYRRYKKGR